MSGMNTGASRIYVEAAGGGAVLDVSAFVRQLLTEVVADVAANHMDDLDSIAEGPSAGASERLVSERLVERLVEGHRTRIALSPVQMRSLAARLVELADMQPELRAVAGTGAAA